MSAPIELNIALLLTPKPPWIVKATTDAVDLTDTQEALAESGVTVRILTGARMRTKAQLLGEFASRLDFPEYFGNNWDALADCLGDFEWLRGFAYVFVIDGAQDLLADEPPEQVRLFFDIIERVAARWAEPISLGEDWDRSSVPFHLVLLVSSG